MTACIGEVVHDREGLEVGPVEVLRTRLRGGRGVEGDLSVFDDGRVVAGIEVGGTEVADAGVVVDLRCTSARIDASRSVPR